jgi:hypothetical protein
MAYTLGEAAKATGKSKSTLSKAIKNGKISALKGENGAFHIDPSELHRVYPPVSKNTSDTVAERTDRNTEETLRVKELEVLLRAAEDRIRDKEELVSELRDERDRWRQQANALLEDNRRASALLEDERKRSTGGADDQDASRARKGFLRRLVGRGDTR